MNSATPRLIGTATRMAIAAVKAVPQMNASAPNWSSGGDQRREVRNRRPMSWNTGSERRVMVTAMSPRMSSTIPAAAAVSRANARSPKEGLPSRFTSFSQGSLTLST